MKTAFEKLGAMGKVSQNYRFFIDALDEYTGDLKIGIETHYYNLALRQHSHLLILLCFHSMLGFKEFSEDLIP